MYGISTIEVSTSKLLSWHTVSLVSDSEIVGILKMKVKSDHHSEFSNFSNWKEEAWKISGLQPDSNLWPPWYRCDAKPTELWSHTLIFLYQRTTKIMKRPKTRAMTKYYVICSWSQWQVYKLHKEITLKPMKLYNITNVPWEYHFLNRWTTEF